MKKEKASPHIPRDLAPLLPYVLTIVVLVVWGGKRTQPPKALGKI